MIFYWFKANPKLQSVSSFVVYVFESSRFQLKAVLILKFHDENSTIASFVHFWCNKCWY